MYPRKVFTIMVNSVKGEMIIDHSLRGQICGKDLELLLTQHKDTQGAFLDRDGVRKGGRDPELHRFVVTCNHSLKKHLLPHVR